MRRLGTSSDVVYVDHRDSGVHGDGSSTSRRDSLVGLIRNVTFPVSQLHMLTIGVQRGVSRTRESPPWVGSAGVHPCSSQLRRAPATGESHDGRVPHGRARHE
jgi:hypothetical protein